MELSSKLEQQIKNIPDNIKTALYFAWVLSVLSVPVLESLSQQGNTTVVEPQYHILSEQDKIKSNVHNILESDQITNTALSEKSIEEDIASPIYSINIDNQLGQNKDLKRYANVEIQSDGTYVININENLIHQDAKKYWNNVDVFKNSKILNELWSVYAHFWNPDISRWKLEEAWDILTLKYLNMILKDDPNNIDVHKYFLLEMFNKFDIVDSTIDTDYNNIIALVWKTIESDNALIDTKYFQERFKKLYYNPNSWESTDIMKENLYQMHNIVQNLWHSLEKWNPKLNDNLNWVLHNFISQWDINTSTLIVWN